MLEACRQDSPEQGVISALSFGYLFVSKMYFTADAGVYSNPVWRTQQWCGVGELDD